MVEARVVGERARISAPPNPWVGALVVRDGVVVATGATEPIGGRHAERVALDGLDEVTERDVLFVTLEPCAHHGRTGPCTEAIIARGIRTVKVGIIDPDPKVQGRGIIALRDAGIDVTVGVNDRDVAGSLAPYLTHRLTGLPWVTLKLGLTVDGKIAASDRTSSWITGEASRRKVHELREAHQAILVGSGTVRSDDPSLTARYSDGTLRQRQPMRIVLGDIPANAAVLPARSHFGDLRSLLIELGAENVTSVLVEGGSEVAGSIHDEALVDEYHLFMAPAIMGKSGVASIGGKGTRTMSDLWRGEFRSVAPLEGDLEIVLWGSKPNRLVSGHVARSR
ncbi:MAG: bifunctional diaminohydroxyphosphoribosylaminopyrimidine deaminase/5-amino-6-(5-phosphoribosylamino)uracil reductase RibD, partial [Acidimicrobiales bacterium]